MLLSLYKISDNDDDDINEDNDDDSDVMIMMIWPYDILTYYICYHENNSL